MSETIWPAHKCSMSVTDNRHLDYYETVEQALLSGTYDADDWPDADELEKSKQTGDVWEFHWYPNTPVGFNVVLAATFERALAESLK